MADIDHTFEIRHTFEIKKGGEPFCDVALNFHNVDRNGMLIAENLFVAMVNSYNDLEQPE